MFRHKARVLFIIFQVLKQSWERHLELILQYHYFALLQNEIQAKHINVSCITGLYVRKNISSQFQIGLDPASNRDQNTGKHRWHSPWFSLLPSGKPRYSKLTRLRPLASNLFRIHHSSRTDAIWSRDWQLQKAIHKNENWKRNRQNFVNIQKNWFLTA
jgi:hypothetical protein